MPGRRWLSLAALGLVLLVGPQWLRAVSTLLERISIRAGYLTAKAWNDVREPSTSSPAVEIVRFCSFACPYCRELSPRLDSVVKANQQVRLFTRFVASPLAPDNYRLSQASVCARRQGRGEEFVDAVYRTANSPVADDATLANIAGAAGVSSVTRLLECVGAGDAIAELQADAALAQRFGIAVTPALVVNRRLVGGLISASEIEALTHSAGKGVDRSTR